VRKPLFIGNWKMNLTGTEATELAKKITLAVGDIVDVEVAIAPSYTSMRPVSSIIAASNIALASQDLHWEDKGPFTGEISGAMLAELRVKHVIVGHSERRRAFGETDVMINMKIDAALRNGLIPVACLGEKGEERLAGKTITVVRKQLNALLEGITPEQARNISIAYEPVWAIGTGHNATPEQAQQVHKYLRDQLAKRFGEEVAKDMHILYGGSVRAENIYDLMMQPDVDGALVGSSSLDAEAFAGIVRYRERKTAAV
jgi:triosephosphate isomerase